MSEEFTLKKHNFEFAHSFNCMAESVATVSKFFNRRHHLNGFRIANRLPEPDDFHLANLFDLLEKNNIKSMSHELIEIPDNRTLFFQTIKQALLGGALCEIGVKSTPWIRIAVGIEDPTPDRSNHSVVIYGYYQPDNNVAKGYFYVIDPWQSKKRFVDSNDVYQTILRPGIIINLFNLCLDHADLVDRFGIKESQIDPKAQRAIISRSPYETTDRKSLTSLFKHD